MHLINNYFKIAIRNIFRNKVYSFINILGLAIGIGACILIYQFVQFELSYDTFHPQPENVYRLHQTTMRNGEVLHVQVPTFSGLGTNAHNIIPEIEDFVRIHPQYDIGVVMSRPEDNVPFDEQRILFVDSNFLNFFNFPLKVGSKEESLDDKYKIVITEQMAAKYFGAANPIGKTLRLSGEWVEANFTVSGVLEKLPLNSHLQFDFLLPMSILFENENYKERSGWDWQNFVTYVKVDQVMDVNQIGKKLDDIVISNMNSDLSKSNTVIKIGLQPLTDVHLKSDYEYDPAVNNGDIQEVHIFAIIALFILIIAWVNYVNLSTARSMYRAKEVGIRKSIGAYRSQLMGQFIFESVLVNCIAAILAILIAWLGIPVLNNVIDVELWLSVLFSLEFWIGFSVIIAIGSLFSGLYPAFILSSFEPVTSLRSSNGPVGGGGNLQRVLIIFQFLASVFLISGTFLVYDQISFMKNQDLGIEMNKILVVKGPSVEINNRDFEAKMKVFKTKVVSHNSVSAASGSLSIPSKEPNLLAQIYKLGELESTSQPGKLIWTDFDFMDTYELEFIAGVPYEEDRGGWVINEEAVRLFDLGSPQEALNEKLVIQGDTITILGVLKNFSWHSLKDAQTPYLFGRYKQSGSFFSINLNLTNITASVDHIRSSYTEVFPNSPFNYFFLDDEFNRQYHSDVQFGKLFFTLTGLAIFIACLGLYALVSYSTSLRVKEIGVRKVLGANTRNLMLILSKEYISLFLIANILAIPIIYYWSQSWLNDFSIRVGIGVKLLLIPGLILFLISLLTVSYQTYAATRVNPVESLRGD